MDVTNLSNFGHLSVCLSLVSSFGSSLVVLSSLPASSFLIFGFKLSFGFN